MIYAKHDFTKNFCNAIGYGDDRMLQDMIIDELARLIVEDKKDVVKLLRKEKVNVTINDNEEIIGNYITKEIANKNDKLIKELSKMITDRRIDPATVIKLSEKSKVKSEKGKDGKETIKSADGKFWSNLTTFLSNEKVQEAGATIINSVLKNSYDSSLGGQVQANQAALNERLQVNQMYADQSAKKKGWLIFGIVAGVIVLGTVATIIILKSNKASVASTAAPVAPVVP